MKPVAPRISGRGRVRPSRRQDGVDGADVPEDPRPELDLAKGGHVALQGHLVLGSAVDVIKDAAGQVAAGLPPEVVDRHRRSQPAGGGVELQPAEAEDGPQGVKCRHRTKAMARGRVRRRSALYRARDHDDAMAAGPGRDPRAGGRPGPTGRITGVVCRPGAPGGRLAGGLEARGVGRGDRLASFVPNGVLPVELLLAAARLGAVFIGVNTRYRSEDLRHLLERARPRVLIAADNFLGIDYPGIVTEAMASLDPGLSLRTAGRTTRTGPRSSGRPTCRSCERGRS